ncbi:hypothetical protein Patl1_16102 [Pistacia atlantica]|uniref:Uncharacterized protein n=1 Tax=Pistacia atlantica TaxID=434234 RepID=A0ACC1B8E4_9ROSI|nr:hypothetical protein Patl1_16102 [Pistacia atlantica]
MYHNHHFSPSPCLHCHPHSYIRMVGESYYLSLSLSDSQVIYATSHEINLHAWEIQVQHLIERCLLLHMNRDQCIKALAEHANIRPTRYTNRSIIISLIYIYVLWRELQKENKDFFQEYFHAISPRPFMSKTPKTKLISSKTFIAGRYIRRRPRFHKKETMDVKENQRKGF